MLIESQLRVANAYTQRVWWTAEKKACDESLYNRLWKLKTVDTHVAACNFSILSLSNSGGGKVGRGRHCVREHQNFTSYCAPEPIVSAKIAFAARAALQTPYRCVFHMLSRCDGILATLLMSNLFSPSPGLLETGVENGMGSKVNFAHAGRHHCCRSVQLL